MKTIKILSLLLLFVAFLSCDKNAKQLETSNSTVGKVENPLTDLSSNPTVCNVENPLTDLTWLKAFVDGRIKDEEAGFHSHVRIYQCTYNDKETGFLIECVSCPDAGYVLHNCEGDILCVMWGFAGDACKEFKVDFENKNLIWEFTGE
jgi:hypothetical protein